MRKRGNNKRTHQKKKTCGLALIFDVLAILFFIPIFISTINYRIAFTSGFIITPLLIILGVIFSIIKLAEKNQTKTGKTLNIISLIVSVIFTIATTFLTLSTK